MKTTPTQHKSLLSSFRAAQAVVFLFASFGVASAAEYQLKSHKLEWSGSMPSQTHTGLLTPKSLEVSISDAGDVESLTAVIDMTSIDVTDLDEGKMRNKLMAHLRSDDFFGVAEHPEAKFVLQSFARGRLIGQLEIRGIVKGVSIPAVVVGSPDKGWNLSGKLTFKRQDFNVEYQNKGFFGTAKDKLIEDYLTVNISLDVVPQ
ncbi:YceI family protein [Coraliomargarita sp. W4R53]